MGTRQQVPMDPKQGVDRCHLFGLFDELYVEMKIA